MDKVSMVLVWIAADMLSCLLLGLPVLTTCYVLGLLAVRLKQVKL